jgi:hypothetical protein
MISVIQVHVHTNHWIVAAFIMYPYFLFLIPLLLLTFNLTNPSSRTMVLGSNQVLTEMSTKNLPGGKGWSARKAIKPHRHL